MKKTEEKNPKNGKQGHAREGKSLAERGKKGLVGHALKGKTKHYSALPARRLLDYVDEKAEELAGQRRAVETLLPSLEKERQNAGQKTEAAAYDGFKAVTNFFRSMLDELKPGETYYVIGAGYGENVPGLREFFYTYHKQRAKRGIRVKMLANHDVRKTLAKTTHRLAEIRFLPQYLITDIQIVFYRDKVFIPVWISEPKGFLIESNDAVESFRKYFDAFWKTAKK